MLGAAFKDPEIVESFETELKDDDSFMSDSIENSAQSIVGKGSLKASACILSSYHASYASNEPDYSLG
jgi:hypothetical protein